MAANSPPLYPQALKIRQLFDRLAVLVSDAEACHANQGVERCPRKSSDSCLKSSVDGARLYVDGELLNTTNDFYSSEGEATLSGVFGENGWFQVEAFVRPPEHTEAEIRVSGEWMSGDKVYAIAPGQTGLRIIQFVGLRVTLFPLYEWSECKSSMKLRKSTIIGLVFAVALGLTLTACQDTKARLENEQVKAQLSQLEKENGDLQNHIDALTQENAELKQENEKLRAKNVKKKKTAKHKHRSSPKE